MLRLLRLCNSLMTISIEHLQYLLTQAEIKYDAGDLDDTRRWLIRAQRELENVDEKVWKMKVQVDKQRGMSSE